MTPALYTWVARRWFSSASGNLLGHVLAKHPRPKGVLFDLPHVGDAARQRLKDEALECLEKAVQNGFGHGGWIDHDSDLDSLRGDPRFEALKKRL